jgi:hydroxyethylthiazole kinase
MNDNPPLSTVALKPSPFELLDRVRRQKPVVHHLTNWVTIYDCAQVVKILGASPVMAHAPEEVAEMAQIASALVLNIGTLTIGMVEAMKLAARSANQKGIPVVLDACGAGATALRDSKCLELLSEARIDLIKGNASEVARISGENVKTRGVDAVDVGGDLVLLAQRLAVQRKAAVVITGKVDIATDGKATYLVENGHPMMTHVVGTGCMAASIIGAFAAVEHNLSLAAASALACYGIAAELAADQSPGPAAFKDRLFDSLYSLDKATVDQRQKIHTHR